MRYPNLKELKLERETINVFGGYNHNLRIGAGEFYDMKNLSSDDYPVLSPRQKRGIYVKPNNLQGMIAKESFCYIDGRDFVIKSEGTEERVNMELSDNKSPKTLVSMGAYVIIFPDKKYINTANVNDKGSIDIDIETSCNVTLELCKANGDPFEPLTISSNPPEEPKRGDYWLDTLKTPNQLKEYLPSTEEWKVITSIYVKITDDKLKNSFSENDSVFISGLSVDPDFTTLNTLKNIISANNNYIIVSFDYAFSGLYSPGKPIFVTRKMPDIDFVTESGNRLWGCKYGISESGEMINEIYASKLGDFKNWNSFRGISTDSYVASVGSDGAFTGAATYLGSPIFFKEDCVHKIYGNYPSTYQIQTTNCRGVQKGCHKSIATVNEVLYYKSRFSVCAYDGSLPVEISASLGDTVYSNAVAGSLKNKYYISMSDPQGVYHLFVYDSLKALWHKEDNTQTDDFCYFNGELYYADPNEKCIKTVLGSGTTDTENVKWMAETGIIGTDSPDKKYISKLDVRISLELGKNVFFFIQYDSNGEWEHLFTMSGKTLESISIPIKPKRCDHLRLRIEGEGNAKIYSISKTVEQGSDV